MGRSTAGGGGGGQLGLCTLTRAGGDLNKRTSQLSHRDAHNDHLVVSGAGLSSASSSVTVVSRVSVLVRDFFRFSVGVLHF